MSLAYRRVTPPSGVSKDGRSSRSSPLGPRYTSGSTYDKYPVARGKFVPFTAQSVAYRISVGRVSVRTQPCVIGLTSLCQRKVVGVLLRTDNTKGERTNFMHKEVKE